MIIIFSDNIREKSRYVCYRYSNGDIYKGHYSEGKRHGHGVLKQGKFTTSLASIYIGQWVNDKKSGYGVLDDIPKGELIHKFLHSAPLINYTKI